MATHYCFLLPSLILNDPRIRGCDYYINIYAYCRGLPYFYIESSEVYFIKYSQLDGNAKFFLLVSNVTNYLFFKSTSQFNFLEKTNPIWHWSKLSWIMIFPFKERVLRWPHINPKSMGIKQTTKFFESSLISISTRRKSQIQQLVKHGQECWSLEAGDFSVLKIMKLKILFNIIIVPYLVYGLDPLCRHTNYINY